MGEGSVKKGQKRREKKKLANGSSGPPTVVCTTANPNSNNIELGLVLSLVILAIYVLGFYESVVSLPGITTKNILSPNIYFRHLGDNLNVAVSDWDAIRSPQQNVGAAADAAQGQQQQQQQQQQGGQVGQQQQGGQGVGQQPAPNNQAQQQQQQQQPAINNNIDQPDPWGRTTGGKLNYPDGLPNIEIPQHKWPVTLRDELDDYEPLIHTGDQTSVINVPKLWSLPVHNYQPMSRELALKIGSCTEPDANGNYARGTDCPIEKRTIFIAVASYRDFECRSTVESMFAMAKNPDRLRVGIVDQIIHGEDPVCNEAIKPCEEDPTQALCRYKDRIDLLEMKAELSIGPVFARHIGHRMYRGEYYATQSDAHVTYTLHWDADIISQLEQTHNEMAVLSTYLSDVQGSINPVTGESLRHTRPIMCNTKYEGGPQGMHLRHGSQPEQRPSISGIPQLQPWWAAGYSFSRGHFVVNVPYDPYQPMIFQGEEMSIGIRGFTIGYDYYAPERSVCFHHYAVGKNAAKRNKVKHFWENGERYPGVGKKAMARLLGIVHMNPETPPNSWDHSEEDVYGIGSVRTPEKFYGLFGIDVVKKTTEDHLCSFVDDSAKMHKQFTPNLKPDGMGIDYTDITYQFHDPWPGKDQKPPPQKQQ